MSYLGVSHLTPRAAAKPFPSLLTTVRLGSRALSSKLFIGLNHTWTVRSDTDGFSKQSPSWNLLISLARFFREFRKLLILFAGMGDPVISLSAISHLRSRGRGAIVNQIVAVQPDNPD